MKRIFLSLLIACAAWVAGLAQETYAVEILPTENGTVVSDKATAAQGETVTLTLTPAPRYTLVRLLVESEFIGGEMSDDEPWEPAWAPAHVMIPTTKVSESIYTFVMPASKVNVSAIFVLLGDVNRDGNVDVSDVTALIASILGSPIDIDFLAADLTGDGVLDVSDVTALIALVLSN